MYKNFHFDQSAVWDFLGTHFEYDPKYSIRCSTFRKMAQDYFMQFGDIITLKHQKEILNVEIMHFGPVHMKPLYRCGYSYFLGFKVKGVEGNGDY
jgi:hypothetical protein